MEEIYYRSDGRLSGVEKLRCERPYKADKPKKSKKQKKSRRLLLQKVFDGLLSNAEEREDIDTRIGMGGRNHRFSRRRVQDELPDKTDKPKKVSNRSQLSAKTQKLRKVRRLLYQMYFEGRDNADGGEERVTLETVRVIRFGRKYIFLQKKELSAGVSMDDGNTNPRIVDARQRLNPHRHDDITIDVGEVTSLLTLNNGGAMLEMRLRKFAHVTVLNMSGCEVITNEAIEIICQNMRQLRFANFTCCILMDDISLLWIGIWLTHLEELAIDGCNRITNDGIAYIARMVPLKSLLMRWCKRITNKGIRKLRHAKYLEVLALSGIKSITFKSLRSLAHLQNLTAIELFEVPGATHRVLKFFQLSLPECLFIREAF